MPYPLSPRRGNQRSAEPSPGKSLPRWPCLLPSTVIGVTPLRNLTGEADRQALVEGFTDGLVTDLFRRCRGLSFAWVADEPRFAGSLPPRNPPELGYVVYGSVQRASYGMLRVNIRISDATTADYLWAGRQEFRPEDLASIGAEITLQISRALHILLIQAASRRALIGLDAGLGVDEFLTRAKTALGQGYAPSLLPRHSDGFSPFSPVNRAISKHLPVSPSRASVLSATRGGAIRVPQQLRWISATRRSAWP